MSTEIINPTVILRRGETTPVVVQRVDVNVLPGGAEDQDPGDLVVLLEGELD